MSKFCLIRPSLLLQFFSLVREILIMASPFTFKWKILDATLINQRMPLWRKFKNWKQNFCKHMISKQHKTRGKRTGWREDLWKPCTPTLLPVVLWPFTHHGWQEQAALKDGRSGWTESQKWGAKDKVVSKGNRIGIQDQIDENKSWWIQQRGFPCNVSWPCSNVKQ